MEEWRGGGMEEWRRDVGVWTRRYRGIELWSSRGALQACRRGGGSSGALEARCRRADVEV